ncbi:hypothetical protein PGQ11_001798 [Apiospora arundinis]|uniref:Uncharacterized protein n=1 Tax=Apiospora arundinis TaxID=335852 RepID=A0ABR2JG61_9PEZI
MVPELKLHVPAELANSEESELKDTVMEDVPNLGTKNSPELYGDGSQDQEMTDADQISTMKTTISTLWIWTFSKMGG